MAKKPIRRRAQRRNALRRRRGMAARAARGGKRRARGGQRRARAQRPRTVTVTATDVATRLRTTIVKQAEVLTRRLKQNRAGISEAAIMDAMGADAAKITAFLAAAAAVANPPPAA